MPRVIETHKVGGLSNRLRVEVLDGPGAGGACHQYVIKEDTPPNQETTLPAYVFKFQKGAPIEVGLNGITNEAVLAIVIDRLEGFQNGDFACELNQVALEHAKEALAALHQRTRDRVDRGVEGTNEK